MKNPRGTWKFGKTLLSGTNGTFENFMGTEESRKNIFEEKENGTFEKFRGTQKFKIFKLSGKGDIRKNQGGRGVPEKHENLEKRDI